MTMRFVNDEPIDDKWVALDLLVRRWGDCTVRELSRWHDEPYIEVAHVVDFGCDTVYRFRVTDRLADQLLAEHLVSGKPQWGYTEMQTLRANESGEHLLWERRKEIGLDGRALFDLSSEWWLIDHANAENRRAYLRG